MHISVLKFKKLLFWLRMIIKYFYHGNLEKALMSCNVINQMIIYACLLSSRNIKFIIFNLIAQKMMKRIQCDKTHRNRITKIDCYFFENKNQKLKKALISLQLLISLFFFTMHTMCCLEFETSWYQYINDFKYATNFLKIFVLH